MQQLVESIGVSCIFLQYCLGLLYQPFLGGWNGPASCLLFIQVLHMELCQRYSLPRVGKQYTPLKYVFMIWLSVCWHCYLKFCGKKWAAGDVIRPWRRSVSSGLNGLCMKIWSHKWRLWSPCFGYKELWRLLNHMDVVCSEAFTSLLWI